MTREEAIIILSARSRILKNSKKTGKQHAAEALEMAIEALSQPERPKGRWEGRHGDKIAGENEVGETIYRHYHYYLCSECGTGTAVKQNYCGNCGADMRKDDFKTAIAKEIGCNPEDIKRIIP